jgi:NAD(P)-dependent dehydrogenase (short-subunit alcohol dehydrogenase family)
MLLGAAFIEATQDLNADRRILNISSGAGRSPTPGWGVYCATKAAIDRYSEVLATEHHGVKVVALAPGVIDTQMQEHIRSSNPDDFPQINRFIQLHEQSKLASAEAVAARILRYLDSDEFGQTVLDDIRNYP